MKIVVRYLAVDGARMRRVFRTVAGARKFAVRFVGEHPEIGSYYAVSGDGVGRVTVEGITIRELFPDDVEGDEPPGFDAPRVPEWSGFDSQELDDSDY